MKNLERVVSAFLFLVGPGGKLTIESPSTVAQGMVLQTLSYVISLKKNWMSGICEELTAIIDEAVARSNSAD